MKQIFLKQLILKNFKGIKELTIDFGKTTNISGENATGKTSVFDAFTWLLFDKDSQDRTVGDKEANFQIKTYDSKGEILHGLEHSVTGVISIDGRNTTLSKTYKEKWTKKRGEAESQLTGHETLCYVNDVPSKQSEYKDRVKDIVPDETIFKIISNPLYFSLNVKPMDRRKVLLDINGDILDEDVINYKPSLQLLGQLLQDNDFDTLRAQIKAKKKRLNDDLKAYPIRIDETNNSIRKDLDFETLESNKRVIATELKSIDESLMDSSKADNELLKEKDRLYSLKDKLKDMEWETKEKANEPHRQLKECIYTIHNTKMAIDEEIKNLKFDVAHNIAVAATLENEMGSLRKKYTDKKAENLELDENLFVCPTCKRPFETENIESKKNEMTENFNQDKAETLFKINAEGIAKKGQLLALKEEIKDGKAKLDSLETQAIGITGDLEETEDEYSNFKPELNLETNTEYQALLVEVRELEEKFSQPKDIDSKKKELLETKAELQKELEYVSTKLQCKETNEKAEQRIKQLKEEMKKTSQLVADLEKQDFLCDEFVKTKVELLEGNINSKFKYVTFKLFDVQVNGAITETCEALCEGVPFSNANTAAQYNAGLDIINTLSEFYGVQVPVFIDNRESVNKLIDTDSQIINLIVSKDKNLKVEVE